MSDLVERLRAQPTERQYDSVGRAYDFPKHLVEEAITEVENLRRENAMLKAGIKRLSDEEELLSETTADEVVSMIGLASRISQQDAELERLRREVEEAKEFRAILEGHLAAAIDDYNEARKALEPFARVAEHDIGESEADSDFFMPMKTYNRAPLLTVGDFRNALALRAKAEETGR